MFIGSRESDIYYFRAKIFNNVQEYTEEAGALKAELQAEVFVLKEKGVICEPGQKDASNLGQGMKGVSVMATTNIGLTPQAAATVRRSLSVRSSLRRVHTRRRQVLGMMSTAFITASPKLSSMASASGREHTCLKAWVCLRLMQLKTVPLCMSLKAFSRASSLA